MGSPVSLYKDTVPGGRTGSLVIGTSAVQHADKGECISGVEIRCDTANTGVIYVGYNSDVTAGSDAQHDGFPLYAGDSKHFPVETPDKLWLIGSAASQQYFFDAK